VIDVDASRLALVELRQARRHNHRDAVHWIDALYRVYISALVAIGLSPLVNALERKRLMRQRVPRWAASPALLRG
jgi:hypothetical protein